jgi:hypothetical protein
VGVLDFIVRVGRLESTFMCISYAEYIQYIHTYTIMRIILRACVGAINKFNNNEKGPSTGLDCINNAIVLYSGDEWDERRRSRGKILTRRRVCVLLREKCFSRIPSSVH